MGEGGDVLEALVGEGGAVVPLAGGQPTERPTEPVIVVVVDEDRERGFGFGKAGEALAVQNLLLQHCPEGFDLAVGPGRADLSSQVLNVKIAKALAEVTEHAGHPDHERESVIAHQLERTAAELEALVQPGEDRLGLSFRRIRSPITKREWSSTMPTSQVLM